MKKVFLGGTCNNSTWRDELIPMLKIDYFNPVVDDWTEDDYKIELQERENSDFVLYVITPAMKGVYSVAEAVDDSNKRPEKTIFCVLKKYDNGEFKNDEVKSLVATIKMVHKNGAKICKNLTEIAEYVNND